MNIRRFFAAGAIGLSLAGCGGGGAPTNSPTNLTQTWVITRIEFGGKNITCPGSGTLDVGTDTVVACPGATAYVTFKSDGTFTGDTGTSDGPITGTWSLSGNQLTTISKVGTDAPTTEVDTLVSVTETTLVTRDSDGVVTTAERRS